MEKSWLMFWWAMIPLMLGEVIATIRMFSFSIAMILSILVGVTIGALTDDAFKLVQLNNGSKKNV